MLTTDAAGLARYLRRHPVRLQLEPPVVGKFSQAVVIPACAESVALPLTLAALAADTPAELSRTLVVVVINHCPEADADKKADNLRCLEALRGGLWPTLPPHLAWIDAAGTGREISREGGVGEARKLGMDAVLPLLDWTADPLLFCLDADTLVEPGYLAAARQELTAEPDAAAGVYPFYHQAGMDAAEEAAIRSYEHYLNSYVEGLRRAGSPYAYHAMGSAIVCRASAYLRAGGMKVKNGGEDFYFLQGLRKLGAVVTLTGSTVHPSARPSDRVPFGTGPRIRRITGGEPVEAYPATVFDRLGEVMAAVDRAGMDDLRTLPEVLARALPEESYVWFRENGLVESWPKIVANTPDRREKLYWAFHTWFDAFRTLKFIHRLMGR